MQGTWYEVARFYNTWENRGDCVSLRHKVEGGNTMFVISTVLNNRQVTFEGVIEFDERKGYIDYVSKVYADSEGTNNVPVEILLIDYDKYVVIYYCAIKSNQQHVYTWILSRTKKLDGESMTRIKGFFARTPFLSWDKLIWDHFTDQTCKVN
ncbi:lopap-like isoform X2 [Aricia agestis]|nr:lopap-like isoform X2 [Aricia agestis]